jgi:hypothetical protein
MYMITHKTVSPDIKRILPTVFFQPEEILQIIPISFKYSLKIISPLGDMVGISFSYNASNPSHNGKRVVLPPVFVKIK